MPFDADFVLVCICIPVPFFMQILKNFDLSSACSRLMTSDAACEVQDCQGWMRSADSSAM